MDFYELRHVIWDWNGTLLDDAELCVGILNHILEEEGMEAVPLDSYREEFNFPVRDYYRKLGLDPGRFTFEEYSTRYISAYNVAWADCRIHEGAEQFLRRFRENGLGQSILSASERNVLREAVEHFGLGSYFTELVGLEDFHARGKLEQGRRLVEKLDCGPDQVLLLGDTLHDLDVACALGLRCVLFAHGHHSPDRLRRTGAPVFENFLEFADALEASGNPAYAVAD